MAETSDLYPPVILRDRRERRISSFNRFSISGVQTLRGVYPEPKTEILRGVYPEPKTEILRSAQDDRRRRAQDDRLRIQDDMKTLFFRLRGCPPKTPSSLSKKGAGAINQPGPLNQTTMPAGN
jgi:hypothetical protein